MSYIKVNKPFCIKKNEYEFNNEFNNIVKGNYYVPKSSNFVTTNYENTNCLPKVSKKKIFINKNTMIDKTNHLKQKIDQNFKADNKAYNIDAHTFFNNNYDINSDMDLLYKSSFDNSFYIDLYAKYSKENNKHKSKNKLKNKNCYDKANLILKDNNKFEKNVNSKNNNLSDNKKNYKNVQNMKNSIFNSMLKDIIDKDKEIIQNNDKSSITKLSNNNNKNTHSPENTKTAFNSLLLNSNLNYNKEKPLKTKENFIKKILEKSRTKKSSHIGGSNIEINVNKESKVLSNLLVNRNTDKKKSLNMSTENNKIKNSKNYLKSVKTRLLSKSLKKNKIHNNKSSILNSNISNSSSIIYPDKNISANKKDKDNDNNSFKLKKKKNFFCCF